MCVQILFPAFPLIGSSIWSGCLLYLFCKGDRDADMAQEDCKVFDGVLPCNRNNSSHKILNGCLFSPGRDCAPATESTEEKGKLIHLKRKGNRTTFRRQKVQIFLRLPLGFMQECICMLVWERICCACSIGVLQIMPGSQDKSFVAKQRMQILCCN